MRLEVEAERARTAMTQLKFEAALGHESRHVAEMRRDVERLRIEVAQMLQVDALRFSVGVGDDDQLRESRAVRIVIHAGLFDRVPVTVHQYLRVLMTHEAQVAVGVIVVGRELPRLNRSAAREPNRRMRLLQRLRPRVDVAQLVESSVERERPGPRPRLLDQIMRLVISRPHLGRRNSVTAGGIHRRSHRETCHQSSAAQAIQQRKFLGYADRRIVERQRVAEYHQRGIGFAPGKHSRDHVRRNRKAVAVLMMLVQAEAVETEIIRHLEFVEIPMQILRDLRRMTKLVVGRRHPDAFVTIAKVIRQVAISLHVKPNRFHRLVPFFRCAGFDCRVPARAAATTPCRYESSALATNPCGSNPRV